MSNIKNTSRGTYTGAASNYAKLPEIAQRFLDTHANSSASVITYASLLAEFFGFVNKAPEAVTIHDWDAFVGHLNAKVNPHTGAPVSMSHLKSMHAAVTSFYEFAQPRYMRAGVPFVIPVPKFKYAGFAPRVNTHHVNKDAKLLSRPDMARVLHAARGRGYAKYLMFLIKKHTGMRAGEVVSIKIADVHLAERWIGTCVEDGARKSNKDGVEPLPFFIPQFLADEIRIYLIQLQYTYPSNVWLFPGHGTHVHARTLEGIVRDIASETGIAIESHWFRHTLNTYRKYEKQCSEEICKQLVNHKSFEAIRAYDASSMAMRRAIYDRYHPYDSL